ncbi:acyltransferase family protein [Microbacterium sp. BH-3-3-3]|uniref:acyltransferase family protein n=1 Tax=Microbacterium sp. BH-3-3-3 TaxID=1906742 RepID=UPI0011A33419|nr:acyltransferase family protein [Microbacterium sp. BH-3-3-3]
MSGGPTPAVTPQQTPTRRSRGRSSFRPDIQALRALAIGLVVVNHLRPHGLTGGYVGVDVFFVISGFLITSHLVDQLTKTGRIALGQFYARRIRRLLPAALLVLAATAALVAVFLPYPRWQRNAIEILASAGYVENWALAGFSVNYSALNDSASAVQHYWSLSVEEQFYLLWPLVLLGAAALTARFAATTLRRAVIVAVVAVGVLSLGASVWFTMVMPSQAYFVTFTRAWEFAAGAVVALTAHRLTLGRRTRGAIVAVGAIAVAVSAVVYNETTPFPGIAAVVPVVGTALIIAAGGRDRAWHSIVSGSRPVQWLGGISYSLYLWHWPLIVIAPFALSMPRTWIVDLGILAVALVLSWATKALVEDPGQKWRFWAQSVRRSMLLMVTGIVVVALAAGGLLVGYTVSAARDSPEAEIEVGTCTGPAALATAGCDPFAAPEDTTMTAANEYFYTPAECGELLPKLSYDGLLTTRECDFTPSGEATEDVWLVGDSHAQQWQGAIFDLARERGWDVTISFYGGCPVADVDFVGFRGPWAPQDAQRCRDWSRGVSDAIVAERPARVFTSMAARADTLDDGSGRSVEEQFTEGLSADWSAWRAAGSDVEVLADPPLNGAVRDPDCLAINGSDPAACAVPRAQAQPTDPLVVAANAMGVDQVGLIDLTDRFCTDTQCLASVGGVPVYYDADHLNLVYVRLLAADIARAIDDGSPTPPG